MEVNFTASKFKYFPLYLAACWNRLGAVKWLLALRGEDLDLDKKSADDGTNWTTPLEIAAKTTLHQPFFIT